MSQPIVHVIGAGLAGSEAAYFLAQNGVRVFLHEMRPQQMTPAHQTSNCAELVCSNSLKSKAPHSAPGMLKAEMRQIGSLILTIADETAVPGGEALAVDRELFSAKITQALENHPNITFVREEVKRPPADAPTLIATGPLTTDALCDWIQQKTGASDLYFYDAIAPIIDATSIDLTETFSANRHDKGEEVAYLNCPLDEEQYNTFIDALLAAEQVTPKAFEKEKYFQGCQPIEAMVATGRDTLRFGPMRPVGLADPRTGRMPFAVLQLRPENQSRSAYNLVGFQTKLKYGEQKRVFGYIPALRNAEYLRLGSVHRNTYVCGPRALRPDLSLKGQPTVYLAGQITGVEGYLESTACGLLSAMFILQRLRGQPHKAPPVNTALGALLRYIIASDPKYYQPTNINFSLFDATFFNELDGLGKNQLREAMAKQCLDNFGKWLSH